jgi:hypothetical protein
MCYQDATFATPDRSYFAMLCFLRAPAMPHAPEKVDAQNFLSIGEVLSQAAGFAIFQGRP